MLERKLSQFAIFSQAESAALDELTTQGVRSYAARDDIEREGQKPSTVKIILSGWARQYKLLADGRQQIIAFLLPGDVCEMNVEVIQAFDHSVAALTAASVARVPTAVLKNVTGQHPRIARALEWAQLVSAATQREWIVNLGQRVAFERIAHLLCELFLRLDIIGLVRDGRCEFPLTQADLADAVGISAIHVNRTLQDLRARNLIGLRGKELHVPDILSLKDASSFNPGYFHAKT